MTPRFAAGDRVQVRLAFPPGHIRSPYFLRGKAGIVLRDYGAFPNPEELAYGRDGRPERTLYRVQFRMHDVWAGDGIYAPNDTVTADIYEHWLEPA